MTTTQLRTEADMLRALSSGTYTVAELYARAERTGLADRTGGRATIQDGQAQYKRRVRSALQTLRRQGRARRLDDGNGAWVIEGTTERPTRALFVWLPSDPSQVELVLGRAADVLRQAGEPIDLVIADPPWALHRGTGDKTRAAYARDNTRVIDGYVEVDPDEYDDFTAEWIGAAAEAIRPGGYLAAITGPERAADVQVAAKRAGLTYVNSIPVSRTFGMHTRRRFVHQHHRITLMTRGDLYSPARTFNPPPEMPRGRAGEVYAADIWTDIPEERRNGLLRYDNALPTALASRTIRCATNPGDLVADPFLGSGTSAVACLETGRRFYGGDVNPGSLQFTMARVLAEVWPAMEAASRQSAIQFEAPVYGPQGALFETTGGR